MDNNFTQRAPNFRPSLSTNETFRPESKIEDLPEACVLRVYLPGFKNENIKIHYDLSLRTVKATGERQSEGTTKWYHFDQSYPIPDYCEPGDKAKFENGVLTITMPKKATSQAPPKQQVQTSQEKGVVAEPKLDEKLQDATTTPPSTTTKVEESVSPQPTTTLEDTQTPSEPIKGRKGQEEAVERVGPSGENQMGEKELEAKPTRTGEYSFHGDEKIQKGQEIESKPTPSKSRKSVKDKEQGDFGEKETKTEKMLAKEAETSAAKVQKEKQSNNKTSLKKELKSEENAMERVGLVSHVFTKFAEWTLNAEEKKVAANIGAVVLLIAALGYYVWYRFAF